MEELVGWNVPSDLMWGRPLSYIELAKTVAFLISEDAKFITGTTLKVDEARSRSNLIVKLTSRLVWLWLHGFGNFQCISVLLESNNPTIFKLINMSECSSHRFAR